MRCGICQVRTYKTEAIKVYLDDNSDFWIACSIEPCLKKVIADLREKGLKHKIVYPEFS